MGGGGWRYPSPRDPSPVPTQRRAVETIRAAVDATVELLERLPNEQVTLEAIRNRSGVSQGSLTHHFGSRDGLIATAQVARYSRTCAADEAWAERLVGSLDAAEPFARAMVRIIDDMLSVERREVRWIRMSAIAAAFGDPSLTETLSHNYTRLTDRVTALVAEGQMHGLLRPGVDPRTVALLITMHAQGLVLDDLVEDDVPPSAWNHLQVRFVSCFLEPHATAELERQEHERFGDLWRADVFGAPGRVPAEVAQRLATVRAAVGDADMGPVEAADVTRVRPLLERSARDTGDLRSGRHAPSSRELRDRVLAMAIATLREHGERGVEVAELRSSSGLSPQGFHRLFGTREGLVREARIRLEVSRAANATVAFAEHVANASSAGAMRDSLDLGGSRMAEGASRRAMWQRIETLAATRTDPELRAALARVQRTARDLLTEQVCFAQERGLLDPELPSRGVARLLDVTVFWHFFYGLDANRPAEDVWRAMLGRIAALLSPDR